MLRRGVSPFSDTDSSGLATRETTAHQQELMPYLFSPPASECSHWRGCISTCYPTLPPSTHRAALPAPPPWGAPAHSCARTLPANRTGGLRSMAPPAPGAQPPALNRTLLPSRSPSCLTDHSKFPTTTRTPLRTAENGISPIRTPAPACPATLATPPDLRSSPSTASIPHRTADGPIPKTRSAHSTTAHPSLPRTGLRRRKKRSSQTSISKRLEGYTNYC